VEGRGEWRRARSVGHGRLDPSLTVRVYLFGQMERRERGDKGWMRGDKGWKGGGGAFGLARLGF
jgi:hypothetical protein